MKTPKISIITVSYNCKDTIGQTIQNVLKQTYPNIEYIIIDGNSTDGPREIIEQYADKLGYWISEPDNGIYDAMNKGLNAATGEWVLFRNSGDYFYEPTTIQQVFEWYEDKGEDLITGGTRNYYPDGFFDETYTGTSSSIWEKASFSHPSTFIRRTTHLQIQFPLEFKISGDFYFFQSLMLKGGKHVVYPGNISLYDCETGISSRNVGKSWKERIMVLQKLNAPQTAIECYRKKYLYLKTLRPALDLVKKYKWSASLYRHVMYKKTWVSQSLDHTLKDI